METRKFHRILAALLSLVMVFGLMPSVAFARSAGNDGSAEINEAYANRESLMPVGPAFNVDTLLEWTPENDPDGMYSRGSISLARREGGFVVNPKANPEAKLMLCTSPYSNHDNANTQGASEFFTYTFNYWQYADSFVYWAGSDEGLICCPSGEFIDAAHTNGVPVVATLGFPWGSGTGYVEQVRKFVQKAEDGSFPVADKLIQVMDFYGFDGYFFNQESYGCSAEEGKLIDEMMRYMHRLRPDMLISWYDSMLPTGSVSYQNAVNDSNKQFMTDSEDGTRAIDEFFMNYDWGDYQVNTTISTMKSIGRSQFDAFAGFNVQSNVYGDRLRDDLLVDEDGVARLSLALYYAGQTMSLAKDGEEFHKTEQAYYVNAKGDPRDTSVDVSNSSVTEWAGMSRFFADKTPILGKPFVTNFNTGHGHGLYVDGVLSREGDWSYQSVQDVLPTWTWIIDSQGEKLQGGYDFSDAYNGGSSVKFSGSLSAGQANDIMLYSTKVAVESGDKLSLTYKGGDGKMKLVGYYGDGTTASYADCEQVAYELTASDGSWTTTSVDISDMAGKTLYAMGLKIESAEDVADFQVNLGQFAILDRTRAGLSGPAEVTLDDILYKDAYSAEARIFWSPVTGASSYEIYQVNPDGTRSLLMETPNTAYYLSDLRRPEGEALVKLEVVALNRNGVRGSKATSLVVGWPYADGDTERVEHIESENLCLGATVTAYSEQGDGAECDKAIDGSYSTKWWASGAGDWMSIDLGKPCTVRRWLVGHGGAGGEGEGMNHRSVSLFYKDGSGAWVEAKRIDNNYADITDVLLDTAITAQEWKLVVNQIGSSPWGAVNIYEWQMFESDVFPATDAVPMQFASAVNGTGAGDTFTLRNVPSGQTVKVYTRSGDEYTEIGSGTPDSQGVVTLTNLDFGTAEAGKVYYTSKATASPEGAKLCAFFDAEAAEKSEPATNVEFAVYHHTDSKTASNGTDIYTSMTVSDLAPGDVVYVFENGEDAPATKISLPVAEGKDSVVIRRVLVPRAGGSLYLQVKRSGKLISDLYTVETRKFDEPLATITLFARNTNGETLTGVSYGIYNAQGEMVSELATTSDSGGRAQVALGNYTLKCQGVPEGYVVSDVEVKKFVTIENWTYQVNVVIKTQDEVEPTDPTDPTDPSEPTGPVTSDTNVALGAEIIAYNGSVALDEVKNGANHLFDGKKESQDDGKWCEDGKNLWVAFNIGQDLDVCKATLYHAGAVGEWTPSPGAINTSAYELYTLNTEKISVEDLLAKSYEERCTLLADDAYWTLVSSRTDNLDDVTTDEFETTGTRIFKINVSKTDSTGWGDCVRMYELELYAKEVVREPELVSQNAKVLGVGTAAAGADEAPEMAFDGDYTTKWCSEKTPNYVVFDVGEAVTPTRLKVSHAGIAEDVRFNTNDFALQVLDPSAVSEEFFLGMGTDEQSYVMGLDSVWQDVITYTGNELSVTDDALTLDRTARVYRLAVTDGDDNWWGGPDTLRIFEIELYGIKSGSPVVPTSYPVTVSGDITGGTVTADKTEAKAGETVTLTVTPDEGYRLVSLTVNGEAIDGTSFTMPDGEAVISATFDRAYSVTVSQDMIHGTVTADKTEAVAGETVTLTVEPDLGYKLLEGSLLVNGEAVEGNSFLMPAADVVVTAEFEVDLEANADLLAQELEDYYHALLKQGYSAAGKIAMKDALDQALEALHSAETVEDQEAAVEAGKAAMNLVPTLAQELEEVVEDARKAELAARKYAAVLEAEQLVLPDMNEEQRLFAMELRDNSLTAIDEAETVEELEDVLTSMRETMEKIRNWKCTAQVFTDVNANGWYHMGVEYMYFHGYMKGTAATTFAPHATVTRGQLVATLYRIAGEPAVDGTSTFKDVDEGKYFTDAVIWAAGNGIVSGHTDGTFRPHDPVTRQDLAVFLYRFNQAEAVTGDTLAGFPDAGNVSAYAYDAMNWAVANGLISGAIDNGVAVLNPKASASRAEAATILTRNLTNA